LAGASRKESREEISEILRETGLWKKRNHFARTLPLLGRKRLGTGPGISTKPKLLLLDEIAGGLTEAEAHEVLEIVKSIQSQGVSIIWIEHIMSMMEGVDRLLALAQGATSCATIPGAVMCSDEVMECYLGEEH
jgi:branched-chain amino acid transport system ATP-binding protein